MASTIFLVTALGAPARAAPGDDCHTPGARCYVLTGMTIDGVTAYPLKDLAPLYADYLAREVSTQDIVRIAQAITDKYRADGYFLSRAIVPPQGPDPGHAQIRVYEGYIGEVVVSGDAAPSLEALLGGLETQRPLKLSDLERRLMLATDLPGVRARSRIEPILDDPARHRLVVTTGLQRLTGSLYTDNRTLRALGSVQTSAEIGLNSVLLAGDRLGVSMLTVPKDPRRFLEGEVSYGAALPNSMRMRVALSGSRAREGTIALNNTVGNSSQALDLRLAAPLQRGRSQSIWASVTFDARHVSQEYEHGGSYSDDLRVVRAAVQLDRSRGDSTNGGYVQVSRGLGVLGATREPGAHNSRPDADGEFWKLNVGASHYNDLGAYAGIYLSADAQWSPDPLLLSETFAPGGLPYGRAYGYAEINGDSGVAGQAELRFGWNPKLGPLSFLQTYAFVDAAQVWSRKSTYAPRAASLASAGGGVRLNFRDRVNLRFEAAKPLTRTPYDTRTKDWRLFATLWAGF